MNLGNIQKLGQQAAEQATGVAQGSTDLADQLIQSAVDQTINTVQNVMVKIKQSKIPVDTIAVKTSMNVGVVQLSMAFDVQIKADADE